MNTSEKLEGLFQKIETEAMDWPDYIPPIKAKLRDRKAAQDAKCCLDGLAKAERVYVTPPAFGYRGMRVMYPLCHKHAVEWAAMKP